MSLVLFIQVKELLRRFVNFQVFNITVTPYAVYSRSILVLFILILYTSPLIVVRLFRYLSSLH